MANTWIPLQSVLKDAGEITLDDQSIWQDPINEFSMEVSIDSPISIHMQMLPQDDGLLVRGRITGAVTLPCRLCTEECKEKIDYKFDSFEPFPAEKKQGELEDTDVDEYFMRLSPHGGALEVNLPALAWEEFVAALPPYTLCRDNCAGLCPECGQNLNKGTCGCEPNNYDLRMSKLRSLKLNK